MDTAALVTMAATTFGSLYLCMTSGKYVRAKNIEWMYCMHLNAFEQKCLFCTEM